MPSTTFDLDHNHAGVRFAVLLAVIVVLAACLIGGPPLLVTFGVERGLATFGISLAAGLLVAAGVSSLLERWLKRVWPSGRTLTVDADQVILHERSGQEVGLRWTGGIDVLAWCFVVNTRRTWVKKGWYCCAVRLEQPGQMLNLYAFFSPEEAENLTGWSTFEMLIPRPRGLAREDEAAAALRAGQRHLREAEQVRWSRGAEMLRPDFAVVLEQVAELVPDWPPGSST